MSNKLGFLAKMKLAEQAYQIYEEISKHDNDHNQKGDLVEDLVDLRSIFHAVQAHDAETVLDGVESIIRRSGADFAAIAVKFGIDLKKV